MVNSRLYIVCLLAVASLVQSFVVKSSCTQRLPSQAFQIGATTTDQCDVAIFGGGFGGLYTALALSRQARLKGKNLDIALVDPSQEFVFLPLLYDLTVGTASISEVCPKYQDILRGTGVRHVQACFDEYSSQNFCSANLKNDIKNSTDELTFRSSVIAVGATPQSSLARVEGAADFAQPFYTQQDAKRTSLLLERLETQTDKAPRISIVGGGYGGVELAACVKRRLGPKAQVRLLTRGPPMKGTRAERLVDKALERLGVEVEISTVEEIKPFDADGDVEHGRVIVKRSSLNGGNIIDDSEPWDSVLWTAGAGPAYPVSGGIEGLSKVESGRLAVDETLRCMREEQYAEHPTVWALGDCTEIVGETDISAVPKTAQAAMQQADVVASNVLAKIMGRGSVKEFQYQDLGTMLNLGGPNAAVMAPDDNSPLAPLFKPLIDTARIGFGIADEAFVQLSKSKVVESAGLSPVVENLETLGLSLGGYGLGMDSSDSPSGTLAGTLTGAARRAVYAIRMPTTRQRVAAATSAVISTAAALAKEASAQGERNNKQ